MLLRGRRSDHPGQDRAMMELMRSSPGVISFSPAALELKLTMAPLSVQLYSSCVIVCTRSGEVGDSTKTGNIKQLKSFPSYAKRKICLHHQLNKGVGKIMARQEKGGTVWILELCCKSHCNERGKKENEET